MFLNENNTIKEVKEVFAGLYSLEFVSIENNVFYKY